VRRAIGGGFGAIRRGTGALSQRATMSGIESGNVVPLTPRRAPSRARIVPSAFVHLTGGQMRREPNESKEIRQEAATAS